MHKTAYLILAGLLASGASAQDGHDRRAGPYRVAQSDGGAPRATLDQSVVDGCLMCHRGELSLGDRDPADLAARIADISEDGADHLVPVPRLIEADREALADALAAAEE